MSEKEKSNKVHLATRSKKHVGMENKALDIRDVRLPLARIRRLMRVEEDARHVALEVPFLFAKVTEYFVQDLTAKAWEITKESGRSIVRYEDIFKAVRSADIYDFLLQIVP
jgi:nuclear transcription factor Y gamma